MAYCPFRADVRAGRILALPTGHRRRYVTAFHHPDTRREMVRRQGGDILRLLVRHRAGHFAGTTADAPLGIGNVQLADGSWVKGFICEGYALEDATDISHFGGWRDFIKSKQISNTRFKCNFIGEVAQ